MNDSTLTVLLIPDAARLIRRALAKLTDNERRLDRVRRLSDGLNRLRKDGMGAAVENFTSRCAPSVLARRSAASRFVTFGAVVAQAKAAIPPA